MPSILRFQTAIACMDTVKQNVLGYLRNTVGVTDADLLVPLERARDPGVIAGWLALLWMTPSQWQKWDNRPNSSRVWSVRMEAVRSWADDLTTAGYTAKTLTDAVLDDPSSVTEVPLGVAEALARIARLRKGLVSPEDATKLLKRTDNQGDPYNIWEQLAALPDPIHPYIPAEFLR